MADEAPIEQQSNVGKWLLVVLAVAFVAASGYAHWVTHQTVQKLTEDLGASESQVRELQNRMQTSEAQQETLAKQAGMTKKELAQRAAELQAQQRSAEARLEQEQKAQISQVSGDIAGVKTDVGGVKTDVASTKADLAATNAKLTSTIGDLGVQTGLIANTRGDLEVLKHKGDRNYYEFTLLRGAKPQPVATVSLQLKKADAKKGKYTLNVTADDKTIEKKDRNVSEPIQFYSGRDHMLFELVVWTVDKNKATGYLSTPKNAPTPVTAN
jgi:chromosome segregation ATPase